MKKWSNILKLVLLVTSFNLLTINVNALNTCNGESFYINKQSDGGRNGSTSFNNGYYKMNFYDTANIGNTYCLDPGLSAPHGRNYHCAVVFNPSDNSRGVAIQARDVAFEKAYQVLYETGHTTQSAYDRYVGEIVFRALAKTYGLMSRSSINPSGSTGRSVRIFMSWPKGWPKTAAELHAEDIFSQAIAAATEIATGKTYEDLVDEGVLWGPKWEFDTTSVSANVVSAAERTDINKEYYTIKVTSIGTKPKLVYWDLFTFESTTGYAVKVLNHHQVSDYSAEFTIEIDKSTGTSGDYGINLVTSYYDDKSAGANMMVVTSGGYQKMLIVSPVPGALKRLTPIGFISYGGGRHKITLNGCGCDTSTGLYTCTKNGQTYTGSKEEIKSKCGYSDSDFGSTCPGTCQHETNAACSTKNGKYFCKDGLECDEAHYAKDCLCDSIPDNVCDDDPCTKDKNSEACKNCSFYAKYCVNCTPTLTLPKTCNNFDEYDLTNGIQNAGYISDIREEDCANDGTGSNVKMCVLGKNDATDTSFEYTEIEETKGNPYCKVYCKEGYRFDTPSAWHTTSGGYFKLQTTVFGQRDCYTAAAESETGLPKPIDEEKFKVDLKNALERLKNDYNVFNHLNTAYSKIKSEECSGTDGSCSSGGSGGGPGGPASNSTNGPTGGPGFIVSEVDKYKDVTPSITPLYGSSLIESNSPQLMDCTGKEVFVDEITYREIELVFGSDNYLSSIKDKEKKDASGGFKDGGCTSGSSCGESASCETGTVENVRNKIKAAWKKYLCGCGDSGTCNSCERYTKYTNANGLNAQILIDDQKAIDNIIKQYNSCSSWTNNMTTNPEVTFSYDDMFNKEMSKGRMTGSFNNVTPKAQISSESNNITNEEYFYGDISNQYTAIGYSNTTNDKIGRTKIVCDGSGCHTESYEMIAARWVRKSIAKEGTYTTDKDISTYTPYGTIEFNSKNAGGNDALRTQLNKDVIPISLRTKTGVFNFTIKYNNLGQSNSNSSSLGRVITTDTSKNSVLKAYNDKTKYKEEDKVCKNTKIDTSATMEQNAAYVCHYLNNCPDCTLACDDENNCEFNECNDNKCVLTCKNCIFDGNTTTYNYRVVSNNSLFNSNRDDNSGYNWNYGKGPNEDSSNNLDVIEAKGRETIKEIETQGNSTYEGTPEYSYILNATQMKNIRKYNSVVGSYNNLTTGSDYGNENALNCDYTGNYEGNAYKAHCRSKFLDYIHDGKYNLGKELSRNDKFEEYKGLSWK